MSFGNESGISKRDLSDLLWSEQLRERGRQLARQRVTRQYADRSTRRILRMTDQFGNKVEIIEESLNISDFEY